MNKKLQVFISSTYEDMKDEQQGAVEAILESGHIPAGMELFAADDKKQFEIIKKWIRESDIFILILGGRYGSIESNSSKSYIQKEYEYAKNIGKRPIAILLSDDGIRNKITNGIYKINEKEYLTDSYKNFKNKILKNKLCNFFDNVDAMKNCIYKILNNCYKNPRYRGWVQANSEQMFSYPYIVENQEFIFKYIDLNMIEYTKKFKIRMLVDGLQYYSDRYAWNAGGEITKSLSNTNQKIVDEFFEGSFSVYTIRLEELSKKEKLYDIVVNFKIKNCNYISHQYLGVTNSVPVQDLKLSVSAPSNFKLSKCRYNIFDRAVDRIPKTSSKIIPQNNHIEKSFNKLNIGKRYNLEWDIS